MVPARSARSRDSATWVPAETGTWETADYFGQNVTQAYTVLNGKYQAFAEQYEALVVAIEKAVENYEKGHDASSA